MGAETSSMPNKLPRATSVCHHKRSLVWGSLETMNPALGRPSRSVGDEQAQAQQQGLHSPALTAPTRTAASGRAGPVLLLWQLWQHLHRGKGEVEVACETSQCEL